MVTLPLILASVVTLFILDNCRVVPPEESRVEDSNIVDIDATVIEDSGDVYVELEEPVNPRLYFIIDDSGYSLSQIQPFLDLSLPLTIAVLPRLEHSYQVVQMAQARGKSVILHQPMEAIGGQDPGSGAILSGMNNEEIRALLKENLDNLGQVQGVNNHMGSKITSDDSLMRVIMEYLEDKDLFFLDSLTTSESMVREIAEDLGVPYLKRDVFLDNEQNRDYILNQLEIGKEVARTQGYAVMIGHAWCQELADVLTQVYPNLEGEGFTIEDINELLLEEE